MAFAFHSSKFRVHASSRSVSVVMPPILDQAAPQTESDGNGVSRCYGAAEPGKEGGASLAATGSPCVLRTAAIAALALATVAVASPLAIDAWAQAPVRPHAQGSTYVDTLLARAEDEIREARFEAADVLVRQARIEIGDVRDVRRRIRLEIVEATLHLAYGRIEEGVVCLERALRLAPALELQPAWTTPKLESALETARARREVERSARAPVAASN